jgi:predicted ArsR family transcriptional regulator
MSQLRDAVTKRQRILEFLRDGRPRTTQQVAGLLDTSGPGALYLLRGLEAAGRLRADRTGRHWAWVLR